MLFIALIKYKKKCQKYNDLSHKEEKMIKEK